MLMHVKRGAVTDRPWGLTLAGLVADRVTGELVVIAEGKRYAIAFQSGAIAGAQSPSAADSVGRIALTSHLVSSTQVAEITRRIAAQPERDEIEVIAEVARLSRAQADTLRRRVITQRASRTFAIEQGTYAFDDKTRVPDLLGGAIEARPVIYLGARLHVAETRLANELRQLGARFVLKLDAVGELLGFGFTDVERPVIDALRSGTSVAELEATHRELDPRMIAAVIYTLVTCGVCTASASRITRDEVQSGRTVTPMRNVNQRVSTKDREPIAPLVAPTPTPPLVIARTVTPVAVSIPIAVSRTMTPQPVVSRTMTPQPTPVPPLAGGSSPSLKRPSVQIPPIAISRTMTPAPLPRPPTEQPVISRTVTPPAISRTVTPPAISRTMTPPAVSRTMTPQPPRTPTGDPVVSRTMTPQPPRTPTGEPVLARTATGTESPYGTRTPTKDRTPEKLDARDAFQRGEMAVRRDQIPQAIVEFARAVELQPEDADYVAMLAWAKFCAAPDKTSVADETRKLIDKAIARSTESVTPRMCLGRVERMLGRDKEALRYFQQVLEIQPHHSAAASEARVLEARLRR